MDAINKTIICLFGGGFLGSTCYHFFKYLNQRKYEAVVYDIDPENCRANKTIKDVKFVSLEEACQADIIFVGLPTPMKEDGSCHTAFVENAVAEIRSRNKDNIIVIKSTMPPGSNKRLSFNYGKIFNNPEFLTEANALDDFKNLPYQIIGVNEDSTKEDIDKLNHLFLDCYQQCLLNCSTVYNIDSTMAEMVKYTRNCYLATRLSFFNEMKQICDAVGVNYGQMKFFAGLDERVGQHYNRVDEGNKGFSGSCLPKDLNALKHLANSKQVKTSVLDGVWEKNLEVREDRDWEKLEGRAVIKENK